jgi:Na+-driven multidrug efflux pump
MSRTETLDNTKMTNGPITRILLSFAGPVLLGQLLQQLYNIADAAIVGQFLSSKALAAVGATSSLTYIVCYFCIGSCIGISVPVSQAFGAGKNILYLDRSKCSKSHMKCYSCNINSHGLDFFK